MIFGGSWIQIISTKTRSESITNESQSYPECACAHPRLVKKAKIPSDPA